MYELCDKGIKDNSESSIGTNVWKFTVTVAVTLQSGPQVAEIPGGGLGGRSHVTVGVALAVTLELASTALIRGITMLA